MPACKLVGWVERSEARRFPNRSWWASPCSTHTTSIGFTLVELLVMVGLSCCAIGGDVTHCEGGSGHGVSFSEYLISDDYRYAFGIAAADLDGDGDLDVTSADAGYGTLWWFENNGNGQFVRRDIQTDEEGWPERHAIGDVDGDGHPDVIIVLNSSGYLLWFKNSGTPRDGQLWQRNVITTDLPGAYDVALADLDQDGDLDVAASSWTTGNHFAWFENDGSPADGTWTKHMIDDVSPRPIHGEVIDMDGDGDLDVLMAIGSEARAGEPNSHQVAWYENDDTPGEGKWTKHVIFGSFANATDAASADFDHDGDLDVVACAWGADTGKILWLENPGDPTDTWTAHMLKDPWLKASGILTADFDGDSYLDIVGSAEKGSNELRWWRNDAVPELGGPSGKQP